VVVVGAGVAAAVVADGVALVCVVFAAPVVGVVVVVAVSGVAFAPHDPLPFAPQFAAAADALGVALGVAFAGVSVDFESPPQATMTADVPSAASVAAMFESDKFGRMRFLLAFFFSGRKAWREDRV
jgi:hypothetical protein